MNNLFNIARNGLSTGQAALSVVGNNLINSMSGTYSRRDIIIGEAGGLATARGFYGYGAQVVGVQRAYDAFTNHQLRGSISTYHSLLGRQEQLADIDNMLGDESDNVSVSLNNLFKAMATMSGDAADPAHRTAVFNSLGVLTQRYNDSGKRLSGLEKSTNTHIEQSVKDINSFTGQLADINTQLERIQAQSGTPPADLLDQRDDLLARLSQQMGIEVTENRVTGRVDVTLADGRPLVSGGTNFEFTATPSASDPNKVIVSYVGSDGVASPLNETSFTKGRLAGLFKFRNEDLALARNELDQIAFQMANRFNEQNAEGLDLDGNTGKDLFSLPEIKAIANALNTSGSSLGKISIADYKAVNAEDYTVSFDGTDWSVKGADGRPITVDASGGKLKFDGLEIEIPTGTTFAAGDSFVVNPVAGAAEGISRAIKNGNEIAAADKSGGGVGNNNNLAKLLEIQNEKLIGGSATLTEAYTKLVGTIGSNARAVNSSLTSAKIDLDTKYETKQAFSGVDSNEEAVNMQMFTQYYQANAQVLETAKTLFDSLLSIR